MKASGQRLLLATIAVISLLAVPALAKAADRNDDGIPDRWERRHGLSLKKDQAQLYISGGQAPCKAIDPRR